VRDQFWPMAQGAKAELHFQGYVDSAATIAMMICVIIILAAAIRRWVMTWPGKDPDVAFGRAAA
jgi:hypothetical protein